MSLRRSPAQVPSHQQLRTPREVAELQVRSVLRGIQEQGRPQHRQEDDFNVCEAVRALIAAAPGQVKANEQMQHTRETNKETEKRLLSV